MSPRGNMDFNKNLSQLWYPMLWKQKKPFHFFQIQDSFVKECKSMLVGTKPVRLIEVGIWFLVGKGVCIFEEEFTYIGSLALKGNPFFFHVLFVIDFWFMNYVDNTKCGSCFAIKIGSDNSSPCLSKLLIF